MIKRSTWILLALLFLVILAYIAINRTSKETSTNSVPTTASTNFLFTQADGILQGILITDNQNGIVQLVRGEDGIWKITQPQSMAADQAKSEAAATQVGALKIITNLENELKLEDVGINNPSNTIKLTFNDGSNHVLLIGALTPSTSGYYVQLDSGDIYVIGKSGIAALLNLLSTPPYAPTETATPIPESFPTPTLNLDSATP
jgi:hypothetical protein